MKIRFARGWLTALLVSAAAAQGAERYERSKEIPVGGEGGWDYLAVEPASHRLFVTHGAKVVVIDTRTDAVIGEIADTPGVHGVAFAVASGRIFTSNGRENKVSIVDAASLHTLAKVETEANPDAILFESGQNEIYAFNGRAKSASVISAASQKVVATIPLSGKPEFAQEDAIAGRVYDNIEDKGEVAVIDAKTHAVVASWSVAPGEEPTGLEIDVAHHRLFAGCGNEKLMVLDSTDGHVVATVPAGPGIDAVAFDPGLQLIFTSNGRDGTVTIVHEDAPDRFSVIQTLATEKSARTMAVDPVSHKIYLAAAQFSVTPPAPGQRPAMIPDTFKIVVCSPVR